MIRTTARGSAVRWVPVAPLALVSLVAGACRRSDGVSDVGRVDAASVTPAVATAAGILPMPPAGPPPETLGCAPSGSCVAGAVTLSLRRNGGALSRCFAEMAGAGRPHGVTILGASQGRKPGATKRATVEAWREAHVTLQVALGEGGVISSVAVAEASPASPAIDACLWSTTGRFPVDLPAGCVPDQAVTCGLKIRY